MVILVGIQGSGKSHVARKLESEGYIVASNDRNITILYFLYKLNLSFLEFFNFATK